MCHMLVALMGLSEDTDAAFPKVQWLQYMDGSVSVRAAARHIGAYHHTPPSTIAQRVSAHQLPLR